MGHRVRLVSVSVGRPALLGMRQGRAVISAIAKRPVEAPVLHLGLTNLDGDEQGDREAHGGPDQAVYAYPVEHLAAWSRELGRSLGPASFGENLTVGGWTEPETLIGDVWRWGDALLQVAQPRYPCYKLAMHTGCAGVEKRLVVAGRSGWYLRVLRPGAVPVGGPIVVEQRGAAGVSVLDAFRARADSSAPRALVERVVAAPALAERWRAALQDRLPLHENRAS